MNSKTYLKYIVLISTVFLFIGCASKAPLDTVSEQNDLEGKTLVIGTISRPLEYTGYRTMSLKLYNEKKDDSEIISDIASLDMNNYTKFENDYVYSNREGSIFGIVVPSGEYILKDYSARYSFGYGGFTSNYSRKINLPSGKIVYIGDMLVLPGNVGGARDCIISDKLDRDIKLFKKQYPFSQFKKENIKIDVKSDIFKIKLIDAEKEATESRRNAQGAVIGAAITNILAF